MKFKFKIQQYQTEAVENTVNVFAGQPAQQGQKDYRIDLGKRAQTIAFEGGDSGYSNGEIVLTNEQILDNIRDIQVAQLIQPSTSLAKGQGRVSLDIEMETGTGLSLIHI